MKSQSELRRRVSAGKARTKVTGRRPSRQRPVSPPAAMVIAPKVGEKIERLMLEGDLSGLSMPERVELQTAICKMMGINPLTKPFAYLQLNGKTVLYALRACTDQLRKVHGVSVISSKRSIEDGLCVVEVQVQDRTGRMDTGTGAVLIENSKGEARANIIMKAETKAKRRATLSICGLGMLDESELDTMRGHYKMLTPQGRIIEEQAEPVRDEFWCTKHNCDIRQCPSDEHTKEENEEAMRLESLRKLTPAQREIAKAKLQPGTAQAAKVETPASGLEVQKPAPKPAEKGKMIFIIGWPDKPEGDVLVTAPPDVISLLELKRKPEVTKEGEENHRLIKYSAMTQFYDRVRERGIIVKDLKPNA